MTNERRTHFRPVILAVLFVLLGSANLFAETQQEHVHKMAHEIMPFDMVKTVHIFKMTETGGVQQVIARNPEATDQVILIQQHLRHEAMKFQQGDFSDPAQLHGGDMPGLKELAAGADHIEITYSQLPAGGEITYTTTDLHLLTAIHRWFGSQLSEHGADARAE